jgi:hypothetical protein
VFLHIFAPTVHTTLQFLAIKTASQGVSFALNKFFFITKISNVDPNAIGMKPNWKKEDLWK